MSKQDIVRKPGWLVAVVIAAAVVAVFATVRKMSEDPEQASVGQLESLESIVNSRKTWDIPFPSWTGKAAPDFSVKSIDGRVHRLSDYNGRNVLVVFWATWCPACKAEIPGLIELRKQYTEDELAILAISNESPEDLKAFVADQQINYSVASLGGGPLPAPFSEVSSIPTTFFIGPDGTIKLTALGLVSLEESQAILRAER
jgi:peroxiredoxin